MVDRPDYAALIAGHADVIDMINSGRAGLPALHHLLEVAQAALGAMGMSFAEYGPHSGRIIAASGQTAWGLGRPVNRQHPAVHRLLSGPRSFNVPVDVLDGELARQLRGRGLRRLLGARAEVGGLVVGSLHAYFPDSTGEATGEEHTLISYLAGCVAHMYGDDAGLPVHGDGPVVAALAEGLAIVDRDGLVRLWNPAAERISGRPADRMVGRRLPFPIPPSGQVLDHRLPDGRWLKVIAGDLPGHLDSRVITFRDATDQHRLDHDRDLFVAVTSHELRTPVTVIKGYADTLANHWPNLAEQDRHEAVRVIGQRAGELARLVDRLLSTASEASPLGNTPPAPFDLPDALRAAADALPADLRRRLVAHLPDDLPKAMGDRTSLATVLTELATNADKYSPVGSAIEIDAGADQQTVYFRVSDRGIGVRPEHVERAFDRFWQGESGDRRRYPGAGLGLYLVRRIVERQNGWVFLRPREGGGTVAEVRLPRGDGFGDSRHSDVMLSGEA
ncbi:MAG TPA: ATP-binding protein [Micromonosporaceae bacterium]|nr:ATP-binding protein [Micromonosporaceae bacterium]